MHIVQVTDGTITNYKNINPNELATHQAEGWIEAHETPKPKEVIDFPEQFPHVNLGGGFSVLPDGSVVIHWTLSEPPYPGWVWDTLKGWVAPVPYPNDEQNYAWNESSQSWVLSNGQDS